MAEYTDEQIEQNRRAWIAALRSGEYEQCRNKLYDGTGYCCLGVAEQLFNGDPEEQNGYYRFSDPTGTIGPSRFSPIGFNGCSDSHQRIRD